MFAHFKIRLAPRHVPLTQILIEGPAKIGAHKVQRVLPTVMAGHAELQLRIGASHYQVIDVLEGETGRWMRSGREALEGAAERGNRAHIYVRLGAAPNLTELTWAGGAQLLFTHMAIERARGQHAGEFELVLCIPPDGYTELKREGHDA